MNSPAVELSIVLPCLNEELTVGICVAKAVGFLRKNNINGEVLVADNGSTDRSVEIATREGARVVHIDRKGYGSALRGGFEAAYGKYLIMADSDDSYDLVNLMPFLEKLREGYALVMGNRFKGGIKKGAMPWHHRYIGNPILSFIGKLFFRSPANDFHCGLRGFTKEAIRSMDLQTTGMELASEIVIKASILGMKTCEVPTTLSPDGRDRPPHLRSFRDGWRHLRFLLLYSPSWLFLYPGMLLILISGILSIFLFFGPVDIGFRYIDFHTFIGVGAIFYLGLNSLSFATITRVFAFQAGLLPYTPRFYSLFKYLNLEKGLLAGVLLILLGVVLLTQALALSYNFAQIGFDNSVRLVFGGSLALTSGAQIVFTSFVLSILGLKVWNTKTPQG
ncbi:MAG TPA: glycosyltransferase family 2 protein [Anaerolineales bacterium]|nr:glycosyltransferase family 2 protein [Anaerolineales bacterium]